MTSTVRFEDAGHPLSTRLIRIAEAVDEHATSMVGNAAEDAPGVRLQPFVPLLLQTQARHRRAAVRLRDMSQAIAARGMGPPMAREVGDVLRGILADHAREGEALWRSLIEDVGVCD